MSTYKLTYFDFDGGRGESIRIALHAAGIDFQDNRLTSAEFKEVRTDTRFQALPVLEIDGVMVSQSNAIVRYVGKMAGLYPADELQALYCDEVLDAVEDVTHQITRSFGLEGEELRQAREALADGRLTIYLTGMEELLRRGGGKFFANNAMTVADLKAYYQTRWLRSGSLDHIATDLVQRIAPGLVEHQQRIEGDPRVVAYYASRS